MPGIVISYSPLLSYVLCFILFFHAQTPESKKQEFRKYLEKSGVIDALTKGNNNLFTIIISNQRDFINILLIDFLFGNYEFNGYL